MPSALLRRPVGRADLIRASVAAHGYRGPSPKGEYGVRCPWCLERLGKEDGQFKLQCNPNAFNKRTGGYGPLFYCYRCEARGSCDLSWLGDVPVPQVNPDEVPEWSHEPDGFEVLTDASADSPSLRPYVTYLRSRQVWEQAKHVGVGACTSGRYSGRVVLPMKDGDRWLGFSARQVRTERWRSKNYTPPKYLYPKGMDRSGTLWGMHWVPHLKDKQHPLYLVEGVFDALPLYPYGLAAFGKNVTESQMDVLARLVGVVDPAALWAEAVLGAEPRVIVCLDGDAWQEGRILARRLVARGVAATYARLPAGLDPGTLGWEVIHYVVKEG